MRKRNRYYVVILILNFLAGANVYAQEMWLRPEKYFFDTGEAAVVQIMGGEDFIGNAALLEEQQIKTLEHWSMQGNRDIRAGYMKDEKASVVVKLDKEGYQFVFLKAVNSYELDGATFNEYLKQYELDEVYAKREEQNELANSAKVDFNHYIQLALRTGRNDGAGWNKVLGLPIEIVPDKNPQTLRRGDRIHFRILENGNPVFGVRVKIWNRWDNRTTIQNIYTEKDGSISTTISNPGDWMVTVVKMKESPSGSGYLADSFCLVFGYR